jgi:predicted ATPase
MRRLESKWDSGTGWPKRLESINIRGIRGWTGQTFEFNRFPIMALTGENGAGKSTVLQCAAAVYESPPDQQAEMYELPKRLYASGFFPDTTWETIGNAEIAYSVRDRFKTQDTPYLGTIRRPGTRWRGNPERSKRDVRYIDLSRIQPVSARSGFNMLADSRLKETKVEPFDELQLGRLNEIMGRHYDAAKMATTSASARRRVPVVSANGSPYSGFHQGGGETTVTEFLQREIPKYSIVLIDEIESSLHPRAQRRLVRDLAKICRERELQILLTTHSPYILEELPLKARAYILQSTNGAREFVYGVSSEFAMSKMDDVPHYECDAYVEDERARIMLIEIVASHRKELVRRFQVIPYGAASVGKALGQMIAGRKFPRASCVFIDGDQGQPVGCFPLPGDDAPEQVIFNELRAKNWGALAGRTGRPFAEIADQCARVMAGGNHHEWIDSAASALVLGGDTLWAAMCAEWASSCLTPERAAKVIQPIEDALNGIPYIAQIVAQTSVPVPMPEPRAPVPAAPRPASMTRRVASSSRDSSAQTSLLSRLPGADPESKP